MISLKRMHRNNYNKNQEQIELKGKVFSSSNTLPKNDQIYSKIAAQSEDIKNTYIYKCDANTKERRQLKMPTAKQIYNKTRLWMTNPVNDDPPHTIYDMHISACSKLYLKNEWDAQNKKKI